MATRSLDVGHEGERAERPAPSVRCGHQTPVENAVVLKHERWFLIVDQHGDIAPAGHCSVGLFRDDTRLLSGYALRYCGGPPSLLSSQVPRSYSARIDLAIDDEDFAGDRWDPKNVVHIRRELLLADGLTERLTLTSYLAEPLDYWVSLHFESDFADIFEVRGWHREGRGSLLEPRVSLDGVELAYRGRDEATMRCSLRFHRPPTECSGDAVTWRFALEPQERYVIEWDVHAEDEPTVGSVTPEMHHERKRDRIETIYSAWRAECADWRTDDGDFDNVLARAVDDLRALYVRVDGEDVISAGIPWYSTIFGRDSIITSLQTLPLTSRIAIDTLRYLAARQGRRLDPFTEEEPGRIMHELRRGEMARAGEIPHVPYFGTVDATPLFPVLLHETWRWTGDMELVRELLPAAERALEWIDRYGDLDGDGLVEYARRSEKGLVNQGWKDSGDGVPFPDGRLPEPPIALVEVQGYVFDARMRMASLYTALGEAERAAALRRQAMALRQQILDRFWLEELGTFALALDGSKKPLPTATSNAGHLLWSRVPSPAQAARLAKQLLTRGMFSGWGIRTLSSEHPVFNPMSYHNGSVWPHDNALIVLGLALYGHGAESLPVIDGLQRAAVHSDRQRLPELFCGMQHAGGVRPVAYPVSCSPQAWASGAFFMLLQGSLGLLPDASQRVLHIRNPMLPLALSELTVSRLRIGRSSVSLRFRRHGDRTAVDLLALEGEALQVRIELA